jgi:two-component system response regulator HydG
LPEHFQQQIENIEGVALSDISPLEAAERDQIRQTLKETSWNQSKTAQLLGIDRKTLRLKIRRYGLLDEKLSTDGISSTEN